MSKFTDEEVAYLQGQRLGRLATVDAKGDLHVVPVGFRYDAAHDTIDIGGHNFATSKKYRDALRHGRVDFVVDDVLPPWKPRFVEVRGTVRAEATGGTEIVPNFAPEMLRITPTYIVSFGVNDDGVKPGTRALSRPQGGIGSVWWIVLRGQEVLVVVDVVANFREFQFHALV